MRNGLLEPWNYLVHRPHGVFGEISVDIIAKAQVDSPIPEPANSYVDFAVVNLLKFNREIVHTFYCGRRKFHTLSNGVAGVMV